MQGGGYDPGFHEILGHSPPAPPQTKEFLIEKVHLDDLDLYVITFIALATSVLLWSSVLKLTKKFNSTSFNLKQEVFIRRDEEKTWRGWYI